MNVRVKIMGVLKDKTPSGDALEVPDGATIKDVLVALDVPVERVQMCTVNGDLEADRGRVLSDDDELTVIPPVGGG